MKIKVSTYSGYKADEFPLKFLLKEKEIDIAEIVDRYYNPGEDIFKVRSDDGKVYILSHNLGNDEWYLSS